MKVLYFIVLLYLAQSMCEVTQSENKTDAIEDTTDKALNPFQIDKEFDFIIIGSGSGGGVLASRLSEVSEFTILLLEAGQEVHGPANLLVEIPQFAGALQFSDLNWGYLLEKEEGVGLGLDGQRMAYPAAKVLGGSSVINYMLSTRGNKEDYDEWKSLGNPGWSYEDIFRYFLKLEDAFVAVNDSGYHGLGGPISNENAPFRTESGNAWVRGCQESGYEYVDYNGKQQLGVSYAQGTIHNGRRCSVEKAYIRHAKERPNLTILTGAMVTEILINSVNKEAYGVKYFRNGQFVTARSRKEVILSAGTSRSPQLLMLSGIGPRNHLEELGVPLIHDLPVGQTLYDHLAFLGLAFTVNESITMTTQDLLSPLSFLEWIGGHGPYTTILGTDAVTYLKTKNRGPVDLPDIELLFLGLGFQTDGGTILRRTFRVSDEQYNSYWATLKGKPTFTVIPVLLHPKSFGYMKLRSRDPFAYPIFFGKYLTDSGNADMKTLIRSIREVQRIVHSPSLRRYNATLISKPILGCEKQIWDSDEYWECGIRHLAASIYHQVSTCKMGPKNDTGAVVDHRLKVHGVKKLRVVDASIFPTIVSGHLNVPTIMISEKAADMIKQDWGKCNES